MEIEFGAAEGPQKIVSAQKIVMRKPDDMHHHARDGNIARLVMPMLARQFGRALIMPNLVSPITTCEMLNTYQLKLMRAAYPNVDIFKIESLPANILQCLMTFYLTDNLDPREVWHAVPEDAVGVKYYPRGLTTNSDGGVKDPKSLWTKGTRPYQVLRILAELGGKLLLHAADGFDVGGEELDPYDQEVHFLKETAPHIIEAHPDLAIVIEHISTAQGAEFMRKNGNSKKLGATVTAHHLLLDRRDTHRKGLHPHMHWWPIIQPKEHKQALRGLVKDGYPFVFMGTDSAPHPLKSKECECCVGGVMTVHAAMELYTEAFEDMGALDKLEAFASHYGAEFYGLSLNHETITLVRETWQPPKYYHFCGNPDGNDHDECVRPFRAGEDVRWKLQLP